MKTLSFVLCFYMLIPALNAQPTATLSGHWEGYIAIQGNKLIIKTDFKGKADGYSGTIDIPQQGATGLPLQKVRVTDTDSVLFEFQAGPGLAQFIGKFQDDSTLSGTFHQGGMQFPFELEKTEPEPETEAKIKQAPLPYHHEDLIIKNDSLDIGGTLTWPKYEQTNQLVIMISGSGAQDRDATMQPISDFKPFATLADSLTMSGSATFRYDDRGTGQSTGSFGNATLDILASDVNAIIHNLKNRTDQNFKKVILLGHSQGGLVAVKAAAENSRIDRLILMASTGIKLAEILQYQLKRNFIDSGFEKSQTDTALSAFQEALEAVRDKENIAEAKKRYQEQFMKMFSSLAEQEKSKISELDSTASTQGRRLLQEFTSPQMLSLMFYEPTDDLQKSTIPTLVLFGGKDTQVTVEMNKAPIEKALESAGVKYQTEIFENANHLFQKAESGDVSEYGALDSAFISGFLSTIAEWIKK